ncbi:MAG: alpha,2-mannosyltransferase [Streptosporangiaceae bacterium]|jgi:alpha-1,2-mannosyltransferase|nr:alpha,2-mannosyltransferase [Streptosporangiaceae bacterium]
MGERRTISDVAILAAGIAIAAAVIAPIVMHGLTNPPDQRMVDLDVYRSSGWMVLRGSPVYDFLTQPPQLLPFTYPPFAALLAIPLALLSWPTVQWLWVILVYAALTIAVRYAFREVIRRTGRWGPITTGALVGATAHLMPVSDQIRFGQVDLFLVALCAADCLTPSPRWPRGVLIGLATAIKLVPGVFLIYLLVSGRRQAAGNALLTAAAVTLGTFALLPGDSIDFWFGALFDNGRVGANNATTNQAIKGMLLRLYLPDAVTSLLWVALAVLIAFCGFRFARRASSLGESIRVSAGPESSAVYTAELTGVAITGLLAVLISPVAWIHHLSWMVLVLGALLGSGRDIRRCVLTGVVWLFYVLPIPWWGAHLIGPKHAAITRFAGRIVQDAYGLGTVILVFVLGSWMAKGLCEISQADHEDGSRAHAKVGTLSS